MSLTIAHLIYGFDLRRGVGDASREEVPGSGVMGRERKGEFQIVDISSSGKCHGGLGVGFKRRV